ncbi:MAG: LysR family transcriptional regulator [Oscillospiraceae bacterium]|nr:LysR family transcriptional regulator [Oscillospiraceae bacterium]
MNVLHMKYAVEVARMGSINKASEVLLVAQPNLSRSIKELESDLGITIFDRSSKGMALTPEGKEFIGYAIKIIDQINDVEKMFKKGLPQKQKFSVSVPGVSYISDAFVRFSLGVDNHAAEIFYTETNSYNAVQNIFTADYKLGIIRYAEHFDKYFKSMLEEKELAYEVISEFYYMLIMHKDSPLASLDEIHSSDLPSYIEISHSNSFVPPIPSAQSRAEEIPDEISRRIFVSDRASQFELLSGNKDTFMWVSPVPQKMLDRYDLVQRECSDVRRYYKDVLIYRRDYKLTNLDKSFIAELKSE